MTRRILAEWLGDNVVAFRLSNGRVIHVPADDLNALGSAVDNAEFDRRMRLALVEQERHANSTIRDTA